MKRLFRALWEVPRVSFAVLAVGLMLITDGLWWLSNSCGQIADEGP